MKKKIILLLLIVAVALLLVACGGEKAEKPTQEEKPQEFIDASCGELYFKVLDTKDTYDSTEYISKDWFYFDEDYSVSVMALERHFIGSDGTLEGLYEDTEEHLRGYEDLWAQEELEVDGIPALRTYVLINRPSLENPDSLETRKVIYYTFYTNAYHYSVELDASMDTLNDSFAWFDDSILGAEII